ncbi:MAG: serine/threonine protein kinase [Isosphaeraceae bacterium]|nr:serine/threonine protein kinase [Isosphaeraceae bacterium]
MASELKPNAGELSLRDFLVALGRSGLLTAPQFEALRAGIGRGIYPGDPSALAGHLVGEGILTEFQARRLLKRKGHGLVIGRYAVMDRIGAGAMGWVFKARHQLMDRVVALKVISPENLSKRGATSRFLREMKLVGQLDHPNVIRAFDADLCNQIPYIVMEYVPGQNLQQVFRSRGALPPEEAIDYMAQAARGLAHAHEQGVIHRDIKPSNLLVDPTGVVKVLDLGLGAFVKDFGLEARARDVDAGMAVGTVDYMAPEQVTGRPVDGRADLFSLGCTLYCLLTGEYPFPGASRQERLVRRLHERHVPITEVRPDLPRGLVAVVDRLLAPRPEERFASATEAAEALDALIRPEDRSRPARRSRVAEKPRASATGLQAEPDPPPLDWSLIEAALQPKTERPQSPSSLKNSRETAHSDPRGDTLDFHRRDLEAAGSGSGRQIECLYYAELGRLNRTALKKPDQTPATEETSLIERWLEALSRLLDKIVSEPSPVPLLIVILAIVLALGIALGLALM